MWDTVNRAALYNLFLTLASPPPTADTPLGEAVKEMSLRTLGERETARLVRLQNALATQSVSPQTVVNRVTLSPSGSNSAVLTEPTGAVHIVFGGTGGGEWIDNGEGLSGIPAENTYVTYTRHGRPLTRVTVLDDHATAGQVEALNFFYQLAAEQRWNGDHRIFLSGHSKGGNKAQFVAIHSALVDACFSFDGQGFSPEAVQQFRTQWGDRFVRQCARLWSVSADNDYVNVLGERLMPPENVVFLESVGGWHYLEAIVDPQGHLRPQTVQGELSHRVQAVSERLMATPPAIRQFATRGVMNVLQQHLGNGTPANGDYVSTADTVTGLFVALDTVLQTYLAKKGEKNWLTPNEKPPII